jgi:hypothetical protein
MSPPIADVEGDSILKRKLYFRITRLRQAANDTYYKTLTFILLESQPELVEGGFVYINGFDKLTLTPQLNRTFCHLQKA